MLPTEHCSSLQEALGAENRTEQNGAQQAVGHIATFCSATPLHCSDLRAEMSSGWAEISIAARA